MSEIKIHYLDPAGNITAIVEGRVPLSERISLSKKIMAPGYAQQVGFICPPILGGDCRLEMMGGEFCGNAARSYGYFRALEVCTEKSKEKNNLDVNINTNVEISGAKEVVPVIVNLADNTAFAQMPLPFGKSMITIRKKEYPLIHMEGIDHLIVKNEKPDRSFTREAVEHLIKGGSEACGILFLEKEEENFKMVPAVYVKATDSLVWESSCGSGSVACAWYLQKEDPKDSVTKPSADYNFSEPGGRINVTFSLKDGIINQCFMGGPVKLEKTRVFTA